MGLTIPTDRSRLATKLVASVGVLMLMASLLFGLNWFQTSGRINSFWDIRADLLDNACCISGRDVDNALIVSYLQFGFALYIAAAITVSLTLVRRWCAVATAATLIGFLWHVQAVRVMQPRGLGFGAALAYIGGILVIGAGIAAVRSRQLNGPG